MCKFHRAASLDLNLLHQLRQSRLFEFLIIFSVSSHNVEGVAQMSTM